MVGMSYLANEPYRAKHSGKNRDCHIFTSKRRRSTTPELTRHGVTADTRKFSMKDHLTRAPVEWVVRRPDLWIPPIDLRMLNPLVLMPCPDFSTHTKSISVVDGFLIRDKILHRLDLLRGVSLPIQVLIHDPKRVLGAIGLCRITRKLSVGHIGIIHERPRRFYHVDPARAFALCQFRSPRGREHGLAEVDPWRSPLR